MTIIEISSLTYREQNHHERKHYWVALIEWVFLYTVIKKGQWNQETEIEEKYRVYLDI